MRLKSGMLSLKTEEFLEREKYSQYKAHKQNNSASFTSVFNFLSQPWIFFFSES